MAGEGETRPFSGFDLEIEFNAEVQPAPTIAVVGTTAGPLGGGTSVLITGADLEGASAVRCGGVGAVFGQVSETAVLAATPPATTPGPVPLTVTTRAGTGTAPEPFTYQAPPAAGGDGQSGSGSSATAPGPSTTTSPPPPAPCRVPRLEGRSLKAAKRALAVADCKAGHVARKKGVTAETGKVVAQGARPGTVHAAGFKVGVKLG